MNILVINAGSSSIKYQLIDMRDESVIAKGLCERIGIAGSEGHISQKSAKGKIDYETPMPDHTAAMHHLIKALVDPEKGVIASMSEIQAVGHRVLHGGEKFTKSVLVNQDVLDAIEENIPLGPLHNPANLSGILTCQKLMPGTPQVAVFDTAFHQTMPEKAFIYGIPYKYYTDMHIRRYGFHGTSHRFVSARTIELLGGNAKGTRIIVCHLGNGSSLSAVVDGKCVDTSMGLTPLEGVLMGTRCGSIDPAIVETIANRENLTASQVLTILNKQSGMFGVSGVSSDMRDLRAAAEEGNPRAKLALEIFTHTVKKTIAAFAAVMGGVDAITFTAGIGENDDVARAEIMSGLEFMGAKLDLEKNKGCRSECELTAKDSKVRIFLVNTNEELAIARDTKELVSGI